MVRRGKVQPLFRAYFLAGADGALSPCGAMMAEFAALAIDGAALTTALETAETAPVAFSLAAVG